MSSIAIYIEGGGSSREGKAALRQGFDRLFSQQKEVARARKLLWKTVLCGSRREAYDAYVNATTKRTSHIVALVVDSEGPVADTSPEGRVAHLANRDRWKFEGIVADSVHLMTQCMEAWIVADPEKLEEFYGQGFRKNALPQRAVLDEEPKASLHKALAAATKEAQKGAYGKINHASKLLEKIRPTVLGKRCRSFRQFQEWLDAAIAELKPA